MRSLVRTQIIVAVAISFSVSLLALAPTSRVGKAQSARYDIVGVLGQPLSELEHVIGKTIVDAKYSVSFYDRKPGPSEAHRIARPKGLDSVRLDLPESARDLSGDALGMEKPERITLRLSNRKASYKEYLKVLGISPAGISQKKLDLKAAELLHVPRMPSNWRARFTYNPAFKGYTYLVFEIDAQL